MFRSERRSRWRLGAALVMAIGIGAVVAACGGGTTKLVGEGGDTPTAVGTAAAKAPELPQRVTENDLALMVLPLSAYGAGYSNFQAYADSGAFDNPREAARGTDPERATADLDRWGRVTGYTLGFAPAVQPAKGVRSLETKVELWTSEAGAHDELERELRAYDRYKGTREGEDILKGSVQFPVSGLGDEGVSVVTSIVSDRLGPLTGIQVIFRVGRLIGWVAMFRNDGVDKPNEAIDLAKLLATRIRAELRGEIKEAVVAIPTAAPTRAPLLTPPTGVPDLASAALRLDDLPKGYGIADPGYRPGRSEFEIFFEVRSADPMAGTTHLGEIDEDLVSEATASAARNDVAALIGVLTGDSGKQFFSKEFADTFGADLSSLTIKEQSLALGDSSRAVTATLSGTNGPQSKAVIAFSLGKVAVVLAIHSVGPGFKFDDLLPLAKAAAARVAAAKLP